MENKDIRKKNFSSKQQLEKLVVLMEDNPLIAKGMCRKSEADIMWAQFTKELNVLGPPVKTPEKWAKVWVDLKAKLKKKLLQNQKEIRSTGGGPNKLFTLNPLEERISEFLKLNTCVDPPGREQGLDICTDPNIEVVHIETCRQLDENPVDDSTPIVQEQPSTSKSGSSKSYKNSTSIMENRVKLLENHSSEFKALREDISEMKQYLKGTYEYTKKIYYSKKDKHKDIISLKKEKLKAYKTVQENKHNDRQIKLKLKMEILELQKQGANF